MKRNDSKQVYDIPLYNNIFPFLLKRRCDSLVFHTLKLDVTETVNYVRKINASKPEFRMKFFYVFVAALMRTLAVRPELNRFIANNRYWQRNDLSMSFVVKPDYTEESPETSTTVYFKPDMVLSDYAKIINDSINSITQTKNKTNADSLIATVMHLPNWIIKSFIGILRFFDNRGFLPQSIRDADGLHASAFVSNLGSIGIEGGSPHHHLYEWGTTSIFVTIGGLERQKEYDEDGNIKDIKEKVELGMTIDERISSGFYFVKSMQVLQNYLNNPQLLEEKPQLPAPVLTRREYRQKNTKKHNFLHTFPESI